MLNTTKNTIETTYEYDDVGKMSKKTVVETSNVVVPTVATSDDAEVETGVELEGSFGMSPLEVFLTAATGALVGSLLYWAIRKD